MMEDKYLEFKEDVTNTFLMTVSAFANYDGGTIIFGVDDNGNVKGLSNITQSCMSIENKINDSIVPHPDYSLNINDSDKTIRLKVESGIQKPYFYKSKAYKRNSTATIEVDPLEYSRLILEGQNLTFEELPSKNQNLTFNVLKDKLKEILKVSDFGLDTLKTLDLYDDEKGYNNAAAILADENNFPGIDMVKFGMNINIMEQRYAFANMSILEAYDHALDVFRTYYIYEEIKGIKRESVERVSEEAFREAIANAIIHRIWDINSQIKVSMWDDRIEIVSPGGLPKGINIDDYINGRVSVLRNSIIANVFYRLNYVEIFGTGIAKINRLYDGCSIAPKFEITENAISEILPLLEPDLNLSDDEKTVMKVLSKNILQSAGDIDGQLPFSRSKTLTLLKDLSGKGVVRIVGKGRGTKYLLT